MIAARDHRLELERITRILLEPEDRHGELARATDDLYRLFLTVSGLEVEDPQNRGDISCPSGKAIGPTWAAMCVKEYLRTKRFVRGLHQGIIAARNKFPGTPIHVLYAGTGPFAALAMPMTTVFGAEEVRFTFIELNPACIPPLERTIEALGAGEYVTDVVTGDAARHRVDGAYPVHLVLSETMQRALQKEPQVAIAMNLVPQMKRGGIMIPQSVRVDAVLLDPKRNMARMMGTSASDRDCYETLGTVFELDKESCRPCDTAHGPPFPWVEIDIPAIGAAERKELCLFTTIRVFGDELLTPWQSSLNLPQRVLLLEQGGIKKIRFQYVMGGNPGFRSEIIA